MSVAIMAEEIAGDDESLPSSIAGDEPVALVAFPPPCRRSPQWPSADLFVGGDQPRSVGLLRAGPVAAGLAQGRRPDVVRWNCVGLCLEPRPRIG